MSDAMTNQHIDVEGVDEVVEQDMAIEKATPAELAPLTPEQMQEVNDEIDDVFANLQHRINHAGELLVQHHGGDREVLVATLALLNEAIATAKQMQEAIGSAIIKCGVEFQGEQIAGRYVEVHRTGDKKRHDNAAIISKVKSKLILDLATDAETGEINEPLSKAIAQTVDTMVKVTACDTMSYTGWRKGVAKALDIDINKYETREGGRLVVTIR